MGIKQENILFLRTQMGWRPLKGHGEARLHDTPQLVVPLNGLQIMWTRFRQRGTWDFVEADMIGWGRFDAHWPLLERLAAHKDWRPDFGPRLTFREPSSLVVGIGVELFGQDLALTPVVGGPGRHDVPDVPVRLTDAPAYLSRVSAWGPWLEAHPQERLQLLALWGHALRDLAQKPRD